MSDFMTRDLWDKILKKHWTYLETEESLQKIEERKKLEACLKDFLSIIQHDRKFFLPETAHVLRNSIEDATDFNVHNAIMAFEAISQYANNLFTKPWRKEFRILKMYSGFFQHEIKSSLIDSEKLFEAMGYRRLSDDILILDGPICPDQVTNVSRDAMTAYVELQIIKSIYMGLEANNLNCSWWEIYRFREMYIGSISQTIKNMAGFMLQDQHYRSRDKALAQDNYGHIEMQQPQQKYLTAQQTNFYHQLASASASDRTQRHCMTQTLPNGGISPACCPHAHAANTNLMYTNSNHSNHNYHQHSDAMAFPQMSHSRSLEHYAEPSTAVQHQNAIMRHSFDHPQQQSCSTLAHYQHLQQQQNYYHQIPNQRNHQHFYESPYDCVDNQSIADGSSISYAAVAASSNNCNMNSSTYSHPYNVSGNRIPLPYNISNQLSSYDTLNSSSSLAEPQYAHVQDSNHHAYASISKPLNHNCTNSASMRYATTQYNPASSSSSTIKDSIQRLKSYPADQLIDFNDSVIIPPPLSHAQFEPVHMQSSHTLDKRYRYRDMDMMPCEQHAGTYHQKPTTDHTDMYVYAKPLPRDQRNKTLSNSTMDNSAYLRKSHLTDDTTDFSYESNNDDFIHLNHPDDGRQHQQRNSTTQFVKNQDGVGSYESWDFVYKSIGHSKDLGERDDDLLTKSLNLDTLKLASNDSSQSLSSSTEKRRSNFVQQQVGGEKATQQQQQLPQKQQQQQNHQTRDKTKTMEKFGNKQLKKQDSLNTKQQQQKGDNNKKIKSALKPTNANGGQQSQQQQQQTKNNDNKSNRKNSIDNNNYSQTQRTKKPAASNASTSTNARKTSANAVANTTQIIVSSPPSSEWNCSFCTYLNPDTKRICEMCAHTKDFKMDSVTAAVSRNAPTCV